MRIMLELNQKEAEAVFELAKCFTVERLETANIGQASIPTAPVTQVPPQVQQPIQQVTQSVTQQMIQTYENPIMQPQLETISPPVTPVVPVTAQTYSMDQLAVAATQIVDAGRRQELIGLLGSFGVQALTTLPKESYGAFATQLRAMGAKL